MKEEGIKFRQLRADEIEVRVGEKKNGKMSLLLYQDARCGMRILDETVGEYGWACNYRREGESLFCGIAIKAPDGTWLWKWNSGAPSNFEAVKGEASDAFKRACVLWGIGRSLYSAPKIKIPESNATHYVSIIGYDCNGDIKDLEIRDWNDEVVFLMAEGKVVPVVKESPETIKRQEELHNFCVGKLKNAETDEEKKAIRQFYAEKKGEVGRLKTWYENSTPRWLWDKWNTE